jgi:hypothetical protein
VTYFHGDEAEKKIKMTDSKKPTFSTSLKAEQFLPKSNGLVLGLVGLIDGKGIDVAQPTVFPRIVSSLE